MRRVALAMVGRTVVDFSVMMQWIISLRKVHWPGPTFMAPEIYMAGAWIGVVPLRNLVTWKALQDPEWDSLLSIDADHRISYTMIERIEEIAHLPIVGGPYFQRDYPFEVQAVSEGGPGGFHFPDPSVLVPIFQTGASVLLEVYGVGTGCMLIRRDVLERMAEKRGAGNIWRAERMDWEAQIALMEGGQNVSGVLTEDYLFCRDVWELLGEKTYLDTDPRMESGHVGTETRDRRHYLASHTVPPGVNVDQEALARQGYELRPLNRRERRALQGKGPR